MKATTTRPPIALVELGDSHASTLHAQIHWLDKAGYAVHLICNTGFQENVIERERLTGVLSIDTRRSKGSPLAAYAQFQQVRRYCNAHGIDRLILNTAEVNEARYLAFFARFAGLRCAGVLHNGKKLGSSWAFRTLARFNIRRLMVLHDFVLAHAARVPGVALDSLYPLYFPPPPNYHAMDHARDAKGRLRVVILGTMIRARKDSLALAEELQSVDLAPNVEIEVLGHFDRDVDPELYDTLSRARGFGDQFRSSTGIKDDSSVHWALLNADLMLPLLYPRGQDRFYGEHRVSGAMNSTFAYKIPMLMHESWQGIPDYDASSFYHASSQLVQRINELAQDRPAIEQKKQLMRENPKFDEAVQRQRYLSFLGLANR